MVAAAPVVIIEVLVVPILAVPILATPVLISAVELTVIVVKIPFAAVKLLVALKLLLNILPVTVTAPKVVVPPLTVADSDNQFAAVVSPSVGQTSNV